jgi:hypothetical protein
MKKIILLSFVALLSVACSSHNEKKAELEQERQEQVNKANSEYDEETTNIQKEEAKEAINDSDSVEVKKQQSLKLND